MRLDGIRMVVPGLLQMFLSSLGVLAEIRRHCQRQCGSQIPGILFQCPLEVDVGGIRVPLCQVEAAKVDIRRSGGGRELRSFVELFARKVELTDGSVDAADQVTNVRILGHALQYTLGFLEHLGLITLSHERRQHECIPLATGGALRRHGLQHLQRAVEFARHHEAAGDVDLRLRVRLPGRLARRGKVGHGLCAIARSKTEPAGHGQQLGIVLRLVERRLDRCQSLARRVEAGAHLGQQPLGARILRLVRHDLLQVHLRLVQIALLQVDDREQRARLEILRLARDDFFQ